MYVCILISYILSPFWSKSIRKCAYVIAWFIFKSTDRQQHEQTTFIIDLLTPSNKT